jgi:nitrogen regulatory protein PII
VSVDGIIQVLFIVHLILKLLVFPPIISLRVQAEFNYKEDNPMFMVMFVLDNVDYLDEVLEKWSELGVTGATIIESSGLHRRQQQRIPMRFNYSGEGVTEEIGNITLFTIVLDKGMIEKCLEAAESVVGDLDAPNTGVFSAWPLMATKGVRSHFEMRK